METWPSILPLWLIGYSSGVSPAVMRTSFNGRKAQRKTVNRSAQTVSASLRLIGTELMIFEYFVQTILNQGQDKFIGSYVDGSSVLTGAICIVGGYNVSAKNDNYWQVTCQLRIDNA